MNPKRQIIVRLGEDFHCLTSPLSVRGRYADEVWVFGSLTQEWEDSLAPLLDKVKKENIHYITAK
jgi:hypothetical protein